MTFAPASIVEARQFLLATFDMHPGELAPDLDPDEVGIVGDPAHRGGYHCGRDRTLSDDYSVVESPRDRAGLTLAASALDVGEFDQLVAGQRVTLRSLSLWLVEQCRAGTPDTRDIREVIYSPDGQTVKRWDRLQRRTSGDSSHLAHTHISYFRDSEGRSKRPLFERFVAHLRGQIEEDIMAGLTDEEQKDLYRRVRNAELILWYGVKGGEDSVPESLVAGTAASPVPLPAGAPLELVKTINGQGVVPTPEQWASLTAAVEAKVASAIAAALDPATLAQAAFDGAQRAERE